MKICDQKLAELKAGKLRLAELDIEAGTLRASMAKLVFDALKEVGANPSDRIDENTGEVSAPPSR